jgi:iron complex transport system ATP-binding protein
MNQLSVDRLSFGFARRTVGEEVTFTVTSGNVLVVLGPNGSGKSTLFRTVLGLLAIKAGTVIVDGRRIETFPASELARTLAYVPQAHENYFPFYVRDVVLMGRTAHFGMFATPGKHDRAVAKHALETLRIAHLADRLYTEISGGERQLVLIARALATEARILVMDEPTANLDFGNQALILEQILRLKDGGHGVLFCTHNPDHAFMCADAALLLHRGRVLALGAPGEIITPETLKILYGVDVRVVEVSKTPRLLCMCQPALGIDESAVSDIGTARPGARAANR